MAFKLLRHIDRFPALYPKVERKDPTISDKGWDKVGSFLLRDKVDYMPQKGLQEKVCACESNLIFMCGAMSMGKAQPYDAKVLTPSGFIDMGELQIGDTIVDADGNSQYVLKIFEQGIKDVYKITFADGGSTECCEDHLWKVRHNSRHSIGYGDYKVLPFKDIKPLLDDNRSVAIPMCNAIKFNKSEQPIPPYTFGCLLGDGCFSAPSIMISTADPEIVERIIREGYECNKTKSRKYDYRVIGNNIRKYIADFGLLGKHSDEKFIPECYKIASIEDRYNLLQGLIDTDGHVDKFGHIQYYTISNRLAIDIQWIVRSLGGRCSISRKHTSYKYKGVSKQGADCYVLNLNIGDNSNVAYLPRKKARLRSRYGYEGRNFINKIVSYKSIGAKKCRCILVSGKDHLYVTDDFIVTHNTFAMDLKALYGIDKPAFSAAMISVRAMDSKKGSSMLRDAIEVCGKFADCDVNTSDVPTLYWKQYNSSFRLIHSNFNADNPTEWEDFKDYAKKVQASYIAIDEATQIKQFKMFTYWFGRNRDASGMTPQMILSFNPEHDHWTTQMLLDGGYIGSDWLLKPEMNGVTRYFYVQKDTPESIVWGDTPQEVADKANIQLSAKDIKAGATINQIVKSFTCFTGEAADNLKLVSATKGQSLGNLHAVGGTQRSIVKGAYFGPVDNEEINVNRQIIHQLWENPINEDVQMYATMDVSLGKADSDNSPMLIWRGLQLIDIVLYKSGENIVDFIERNLKRYNVPISNFAYDATGAGMLLEQFVKSGAIGITANRRCVQEIDANGNNINVDEYFNLRSQLLGKTEVMLRKGDISIAVEKDRVLQYGKGNQTRRLFDILCDEVNVFTTITRNKKIYYRSKEEYKSKFKSSPDLIDAFSYRAYFELSAKERKQPKPQVAEDAYDALYSHRHRPIYSRSFRNYR